MIRTGVLFGLFLIFLTPLFAGGGAEELPEAVRASDGFMEIMSDGFEFRWMVDGDEVELHLGAATTGWVGVGFNPSTVMAEADFTIGYVVDGRAVVRDDYGTGLFTHGSDESLGGANNLRIIGGEEADGFTRFRVRKPLSTGDAYDAELAAGDEVKVIWAIGPNGSDNAMDKHRARGSITIRL